MEMDSGTGGRSLPAPRHTSRFPIGPPNFRLHLSPSHHREIHPTLTLRMKPFLLLPAIFLAACSGGLPTVSSSINTPLALLPEKPEKGKLFTYYQARDGSRWERNWTSGLDFTGVSWNDPRTATLISPSHVVMAAHFPRDSHTPVMFHDRAGQPVERYIVAAKPIPGTDISVGKLNMPVPSDIKKYRFAKPADTTPGTPVLITDQTMTISIHEVAAIHGGVIRFQYHPTLDPIYRRNLITGDSGNPSFILKSGELFLLETHTTGGPGAGPFFGDPAVQAAVRGAMAELGN